MPNEGYLAGFRPANAFPKIRWLPVAATQTLAPGDLVILSNNQIAIATATSAELCGAMAGRSVLADAGTLVPVYADPDEEFVCIADADSSGVGAGDYRDIVGATGAMQMDVGGTTYNVLTALRANPDATLTSAYAQWIVKIALHAFADISS